MFRKPAQTPEIGYVSQNHLRTGIWLCFAERSAEGNWLCFAAGPQLEIGYVSQNTSAAAQPTPTEQPLLYDVSL